MLDESEIDGKLDSGPYLPSLTERIEEYGMTISDETTCGPVISRPVDKRHTVGTGCRVSSENKRTYMRRRSRSEV